MGKYGVPEKIRKMKPKGTAVKSLKGGFYVYAQTNKWDEKLGRRLTKTGEYLGKIDPKYGFIPKELAIIEENTVAEFGQFAFAYLAGEAVKERLNKFFDPITSEKIYLISIIHLINGFTYQKYFKDYFEMSCFKILFKRWKFGDQRISDFYEWLGTKINHIDGFERSLMNNTNQIAIDGHAIASSSECNDLTSKGNKYPNFKTQQVNLIMGYDLNNHRPVFSHINVGDCIDSISPREILGRRIFKNILFTIGKGFYNESNLSTLDDMQCQFIIPAEENLSYLNNFKSKAKFTSKYFVYKSNSTKTVIYYESEKLNNGRTIYGFRDISKHAIECDDYLDKVKMEKLGYTHEKFEELKHNFGTAWLLTNSNDSPDVIFATYKKRWNIETFYNTLKNKLNFNALHCQDYYIEQALAFVILVVSLIQCELKKKLNVLKYENLDEFLVKTRGIKIRKDDGVWRMTATSIESINKCINCGVDLNKFMKEINEIDNL